MSDNATIVFSCENKCGVGFNTPSARDEHEKGCITAVLPSEWIKKHYREDSDTTLGRDDIALSILAYLDKYGVHPPKE